MRTEYLEEFIAFSRHLSFSETAEELFIAKSTLSTHIANLERELGLKLVDRDNDNALTQEGALFLDGAKAALETLDSTIARCTQFREEAAGRVRIACLTPTASLAALLSERLDVPFQFVDRDFASSRSRPSTPTAPTSRCCATSRTSPASSTRRHRAVSSTGRCARSRPSSP